MSASWNAEVLALLCSDVVESTRLNVRLGDAAMAGLWDAHDRTARGLLGAWDGREVGRGDGFLMIFPNAEKAVGFALSYQRSLAALRPPLEARVGIHVGQVRLRENSSAETDLGARRFDVDGVALPVVARVMSLAIGRQTLLSEDAARGLNAGPRLKSHGHWRLKGLPDPIQLFEVGEDLAPFVPPPDVAKAYRVVWAGDVWIPAAAVPNNLPAERDAFVGRQAELARLSTLIDSGARLITLLGIGGIGKTRLGLRYARSWLGDFPGGAWFCDLSRSRSSYEIVQAVALGLDVTLGETDPIQQVGSAIAGRGVCLVILDNFEQVTRHAEETLGAWLERAPEARFVATSREVLGIAGEHSLVLPPLDDAEAQTMFRDRVRAVGLRTEFGVDDAAAVGPLVNLLDRLPLAIELAAARARVMPPRVLLARMGERFKLLASRGGRRDRQATLRATLDWSWDLLSASERSALAQLSLFEGGFTLAAAEAVIDVSDLADAKDGTSLVQALLEKSLIVRRSNERFDLLNVVQEYAAERLKIDGGPEALRSASDRHGDFYATVARSRDSAAAVTELANLVAATRRAARADRADCAVCAMEGAYAAFKLRGPFQAVLDLANDVRSIPSLDSPSLARVARMDGWALKACGRMSEAEACLESALVSARACGAKDCEGLVLSHLGDLHANVGQLDLARTEFEAALSIATQLDDPPLACEANNGLGNCYRRLGSFDDARKCYQAVLEAARKAGDRRWEGGSLGSLGKIFFEEGRKDEAGALYSAALAIARELGDRQWEGNRLCNLGLLHQEQGRLEEALSELQAALQIARELGYSRLECIVLFNLGILFDACGRRDAAREHYTLTLDLARGLHDRRTEGQVRRHLGLLSFREGRFDDGRASMVEGEACLTSVRDTWDLALLHCARSEGEHLAGDQAASLKALATAEALASELKPEAGSEVAMALARTRTLIAPDPSLVSKGSIGEVASSLRHQ